MVTDEKVGKRRLVSASSELPAACVSSLAELRKGRGVSGFPVCVLML